MLVMFGRKKEKISILEAELKSYQLSYDLRCQGEKNAIKELKEVKKELEKISCGIRSAKIYFKDGRERFFDNVSKIGTYSNDFIVLFRTDGAYNLYDKKTINEIRISPDLREKETIDVATLEDEKPVFMKIDIKEQEKAIKKILGITEE